MNIRDEETSVMGSLGSEVLLLSSNRGAPFLLVLDITFHIRLYLKKKLFEEITSFNLCG